MSTSVLAGVPVYEPLVSEISTPAGAVMEILAVKFDPEAVYDCSPELVPDTTCPKLMEVGFTVMLGGENVVAEAVGAEAVR